MKSSCYIVSLLFLIIVLYSTAFAQVKQGFGFFGGFAQETSEVIAFGDEYKTPGVGFGVDFQLPLGDSFSLNPFIMGSVGKVEGGNFDGFDADHFIIALQGRLWAGDSLYLGVHTGYYSQTLTKQFGDVLVKNEGNAFGYGLALGAEIELNPKAALIIAAQYDTASNLDVFPDTDINLTSIRVQAGVRIFVGN